MSYCGCANSILNTGRPSYAKGQLQASKIWISYLFQEDGTRNFISAPSKASPIDDTVVDGLINNADPFQRIYPLGEFQDQTDEKADTVFQEFNDGTRIKVRDGIRTFTGMLVDYGPEDLEYLDAWGCKQIGIYEIDRCGNLIGDVDPVTGNVHPIPIQRGSWDAMLMKGNNESAGMIQLSFQISKLFKDVDYRGVQANSDYLASDLLSKIGLIQLKVDSQTVTSTTEFDISVVVASYRPWDKRPAAGLSTADFVVTNTTTSSTVTPSGVVEAPDGTYTFTIPAQTTADVLKVSFVGDGKAFEDFTLDPIP